VPYGRDDTLSLWSDLCPAVVKELKDVVLPVDFDRGTTLPMLRIRSRNSSAWLQCRGHLGARWLCLRTRKWCNLRDYHMLLKLTVYASPLKGGCCLAACDISADARTQFGTTLCLSLLRSSAIMRKCGIDLGARSTDNYAWKRPCAPPSMGSACDIGPSHHLGFSVQGFIHCRTNFAARSRRQA
jgi:hypothetical protein